MPCLLVLSVALLYFPLHAFPFHSDARLPPTSLALRLQVLSLSHCRASLCSIIKCSGYRCIARSQYLYDTRLPLPSLTTLATGVLHSLFPQCASLFPSLAIRLQVRCPLSLSHCRASLCSIINAPATGASPALNFSTTRVSLYHR